MIELDSALKQLLENANTVTQHRRLTSERVGLDNLLGRVCAEDIISNMDVPPADNSAMDGYALNTAALVSGHAVRVSQRIAAGQTPLPLKLGTVARLFTGAEIPFGANAVVMQENCTVEDGGLLINKLPETGENIRLRGQDIQAGKVIIQSGTKLQPQHLGLIASVGNADALVHKKLKVAILSTGDELIEPGQTLRPGQIYNSNQMMLSSLCQQLGYDVVIRQTLKDDFQSTCQGLQLAAQQADLVVTCGGVSVGEEDHVKAAVQQLGALNLWKVAIKPGKPFAFGHINHGDQRCLMVGLPGNPVSALITFLLLAKPLMQKLQGQQILPLAYQQVVADFSRLSGRRKEFLRGGIRGEQAFLYPNQSSGVLSSIIQCDGFIVQDIDQNISIGDKVAFIPISQLMG